MAEPANGGNAPRPVPESDDLFRTLTENAFDLICLVDAQGVYRYLSPNHRPVLGWDVEKMVGCNALDMVHPSQRDLVERRLQTAVEEGSGVVEVQIRAADGQWRWFEATGQAYRAPDGETLFVTVSRDVTARRQAEELLRREQKYQRRLVALLDCERRLMAFEIHDGLVQDLFGAQLFLESIGPTALDDPELRTSFESALRLLRGAIEEARRLINGLRPPILDEKGLIPALEHLVEDFEQTWRLDIDFRAEVEFDRLSPAVENSIYRIVQEGLNNVQKHSGAGAATIQLVQHDGRVRIVVADDGQGFDPSQVFEKRYGLEGIRERARLLEGEARIESEPGKGTCVTVILPMVSVEEPTNGDS